jgi:type I restriction enzyme, R subunit
LRQHLIECQQRNEIMIDETTQDTVLAAGFDVNASERARTTVESFRRYIDEHRNEIVALDLLYQRPHSQRHVTYQDIQELAEKLRQPPYNWTTEQLWQAYAQVNCDKVRGVNAPRLLTDLISLVRHAVQLEDELVPYPEVVQQRYQAWLADQAAAGREFTPEQRWWLDRIAEQIGVNVELTLEDLDNGEFFDRGGRWGLSRVLGNKWQAVLNELNVTLSD